MIKGGPSNGTMILEYNSKSETLILCKVKNPFFESAKYILYAANTHIRERFSMYRCVNYDFMGTDAVHPVIEANTFFVEGALNAQGRKLVWNDPQKPVRAVW